MGLCVFSVITVLRLFFECLSVFVAEAVFLPNQNSAGATVSEQYRRSVFLCTRVVFVCVCSYAHGKEQSKELCGGEIV